MFWLLKRGGLKGKTILDGIEGESRTLNIILKIEYYVILDYFGFFSAELNT